MDKTLAGMGRVHVEDLQGWGGDSNSGYSDEMGMDKGFVAMGGDGNSKVSPCNTLLTSK